MIEIAITPRSFRATRGAHHDALEARGVTPRYPDAERPLDAAEMAAFVSGCPGLIVGNDPVSAEVLHAGPLRAVVKYGSGMDNIDLAAARRLGVSVESTAGTNARSVAELTIALMLAVARNVPLHDRTVRSGGWSRRTAMELEGKRLGLIGYGAIGREVATIAAGLGMEVVVHDPYAEVDLDHVSMEQLLSGCDVVSLHLPLTEETRGVIGRAEIGQLKDGAILINTARGGLVDEDALADRLRAGHLRGAAFDTFVSEPPKGSPLLESDAFIASPHAGATTIEAVERTGVFAVERMIELLRDLGS